MLFHFCDFLCFFRLSSITLPYGLLLIVNMVSGGWVDDDYEVLDLELVMADSKRVRKA